MADSKIVITAGLSIPESVSTIEKDLKGVSEKLTADKALKIVCNIDLSKTTQRIQSQLATISKNLTVDVGGLNIDISSINENVSHAVDKLQNSMNNLRTNARIDLSVNSEAIEQFIDKMSELNVYGVNIEELRKRFENLNVSIEKITPTFVTLEEGGEKLLSSLSIKGKDSFGNLVNYIETYNAKTGEFVKSTTKVSEDLGKIESAQKKIKIETDNAQKSLNEFLELQNKFQLFFKQYGNENSLKEQFENISGLMSEFDNTAPLDKQRESLIRIDGALKLIKVDIDALNKASAESKSSGSSLYPQIEFSKGDATKDILSKAKTNLNDYFNAEQIESEATRVKRAVEDTSGELQRFYVQVERGDKAIETLTYSINEQGTAYEYLGKTIREADNSTDFRRKDINTQWTIQTEKLQQFITNAERAGVATTVLGEDIAKLQDRLGTKGDTNAMNAFLDDFDIAKAKFQAFNAVVRKDTAIVNFNNRIKRLSADMNAYASANQRAVDSTKKMTSGISFADEWTRLSTEMTKGANLTEIELKNLTADMAVFKKEAKAAGLEGASAFEKFAKSFKLISTYISANQLINMVIRQIRSAVTELQTVDERLTEISKTSDRTTESLIKLGNASYDTASKYGRTASDYLLGVQEMSRAGFGEVESENLAELSILAQAAGDMTAEMANEYLIATNAAYGLEGSVEELNRVLDSQNFITNHNALNMENLSQATKVAASQAAASGVAVDELTAAVGTMVATTQQGGDVAGRAFKGILMNLQQVKGAADDIGDGGEDITTESLSKYEAAAKALGVSLKEVKNGVLQLRDPMEILRELSVAVRQESEGSIKVANLVAAVGGKFRGNQLIALLNNWDTYEKMMSEFNSNQAVGSAMEEAEKSANNWAGSLNKVKNSWAELTNQFINSDNAITVIQSLDKIIQNITDSTTTGGLKVLADRITGIIKLVGNLSDVFGAIPLLIAGITTAKGVGRPHKPNMPKLVLLQINVRSDTPQNKRAFQMLELRVADTQPKAA